MAGFFYCDNDSNNTKNSVYGHSSIWEHREIWSNEQYDQELPADGELNRCSTPLQTKVPFSTGSRVTFNLSANKVKTFVISEEERSGKRFWNRFSYQWRRFCIVEKRLNLFYPNLTFAELRIKFKSYLCSIPCENRCSDYDKVLDFEKGQQLDLATRFQNTQFYL